MDAVLPAWLQVVMGAVLGVSVTVNVAFIVRNSQYAKLKEDIASAMQEDRHELRNMIVGVSWSVQSVHADFAQFIAMHHKELAGTLPRPLPPPPTQTR